MMSKRKTLSIEKDQTRFGWMLNFPTLAILFVTILVPILYSLYISFQHLNYKQPNRTKFIWLQNYIELFQNQTFLHSLAVTGLFVLLTVSFILVFGLAIAHLLKRNFKGNGLLRTIVLIPWAIPPVVNGVMWKFLLDSSYGAINSVLYQLGLISSYQSFLSDPNTAFAWVVFANVWKNLPFAILLLFAALQTIPTEMYESAVMDGASSKTMLFKITIPLVSSTMLVLLIFQTMASLREFDLIYVMTSGGPGDATSVIGWLLYTQSFKFLDFGKGSAIGYIITMITLVIAMCYYRIFKNNIES
ncbi:sugar ABC transporter permease [uncultured Sphaerochaeta sp.]|uniref:carbohydrate ABC transporter permease n=1 Tax=uncultured Sphaerochaeta sp. TaxID=886478 RepID=UPI002A0A22B9|nr:sugar ABC transporter permease [uncultured Sphaerochaeta sp.]